ncbi:MAG: hypothetical protein ONB31_00765 [candidate division KSB1 bacterium]|nr:hypothetical protein [candidate division KSB1 bacterium]MDZ7334350.1 hypothetical protein [candidate division KSB1 bacterium]MDZ7356391.1 hypothetical protein [candidate division KSB1 bacterium]MDZ7399301.1 hypothetical protein [candidate division KSB1 bacterium]
MMTKKLVAIFILSILMIIANQPIFSQNGAEDQAQMSHSNKERLAFFEKISKQYYGDKQFASELELVNRLVRIDRAVNHSNLIIPSYEAIVSMRYQGLESSFMPDDEIAMSSALVQFGSSPSKFDKTTDMTTWHPSTALFMLVVFACLLSLSFSIAIYFRYRQKIQSLALAGISKDESIAVDKSRLVDYELAERNEAPIAASLAVLQGAN